MSQLLAQEKPEVVAALVKGNIIPKLKAAGIINGDVGTSSQALENILTGTPENILAIGNSGLIGVLAKHMQADQFPVHIGTIAAKLTPEKTKALGEALTANNIVVNEKRIHSATSFVMRSTGTPSATDIRKNMDDSNCLVTKHKPDIHAANQPETAPVAEKTPVLEKTVKQRTVTIRKNNLLKVIQSIDVNAPISLKDLQSVAGQFITGNSNGTHSPQA